MVGAKTGVAACINKIVRLTYCGGPALQLLDGDTIKPMQIIRGSLDAAFELTKVIKCSIFLKS